jgi:hypothetical protein
MSIAFSTDTESYISNLTQLIEEIREEMDDSGYSLDKIYRGIGRAEAMFNREIRVPQMESDLDISVTQEYTELPSDFLGLRSVYIEGDIDRPLQALSPEGLRQQYMGKSGTPRSYALEGNRLIVGPVGSVSLTLTYYAKLVPLTENNPTNWLLRDYPDLYLHQTLAILFGKIGDRERAADNLGLATALIGQVNSAGRKARFGSAPLSPVLVTQVRGSRI